MSYLNARYYDGGKGKFLSQDPLFLAIGDNGRVKELTRSELQEILSDPQSLHSYAYGRNNPLIYVDKDGEFAQVILGAGAAVAGQYAYDVFNNVRTNGFSGKGFFSNLSSLETYGVRAGQGAVIALTGGAVGGLSVVAQMGVMGTVSGLTGVLGDPDPKI